MGSWIRECFPEASLTLSHNVAQLGLLLRENSAILNECLKPLAHKVVSAFSDVFKQTKFSCPFFLTQNDGTLLRFAAYSSFKQDLVNKSLNGWFIDRHGSKSQAWGSRKV